ncbi:m7GpppX diphosphatase [Drosophila tropicalis]|uniref:m7GpppX diphosphatase n=1 Tax=Drosophila tropicalis TaxID=46794 RepID=UPI0035AB7FCE
MSPEQAATEESSSETPTYELKKFQLKRILNNNTVRKSIALLGTFPDLSPDNSAIVVFEKNAYRESDVATDESEALDKEAPSYFSGDLNVATQFVNNIYGSYQVVPRQELCAVKSTVIYPATEKHIQKYSICQKYLINETPDLYKKLTLPYLLSKADQFSLEWVYNILEHKQETERIVFEDKDPETGFVLLPDLKWDGVNVENLYLLGIVHQHNLKSLRDLRGSHLPLLRNLRQSSKDAIQKRYGLNPSQLRMYFHYQPSFYHLHVHINPIRNDAPGIWCEKSHMLDTVINNLELMPDYYQRATLPFVLYEGNKLLDLYEEQSPVRTKIVLPQDTKDENTPSQQLNDEDSDEDEHQCKRVKLDKAETNESEIVAPACA